MLRGNNIPVKEISVYKRIPKIITKNIRINYIVTEIMKMIIEMMKIFFFDNIIFFIITFFKLYKTFYVVLYFLIFLLTGSER